MGKPTDTCLCGPLCCRCGYWDRIHQEYDERQRQQRIDRTVRYDGRGEPYEEEESNAWELK
jgi:hypothetical protein